MIKNKLEKVQKRDGTIADFDRSRIETAIHKALTATVKGNGKKSKQLTDRVIQILNRRFKIGEIPHVEQIQDVVEEVLILEGLVETAKAYIIYREQRKKIREAVDAVDESASVADQYIQELDWQVKENANMAYSLQGLNHYATSIFSQKYWLNKIYPKEIREAAESGDFHLHNLDTLAPYCAGWDLYDLLLRGFGGVSGKVETKPARHFRTALGQAVNFLYTITGEIAGAVAFSNFDTLLAPFIRYDNLNYLEVKQCLQEFLFNMSVPTRVGFQNPFSNITLDIKVSPVFAKTPVIIGGQPQKETYAEFQEEIDMFNRALYEGLMAGDAHGRVFTFPIPTINITKDFEWDNPALEPLWEATAKYGVNYFSNYINSDMKPEDIRSMCPLAGDEKVLIKSSRGRGLEYSTIKFIYNGNSKQEKYWIYSDGKFVKGKFSEFANQKMLRVVLANNHEVEMSEEHLNFVLKNKYSKTDTLPGKSLRPGMYLPYSLNVFKGNGGNTDLGYFVGAYAGDGSLDRETSVVFSLSKDAKQTVAKKLQKIGEKYFGAHSSLSPDLDTGLLTLKIHARAAVGLCRDFVVGKERDKNYASKIFGTSEKFRRGAIEGHLATDGGNRNRIYTSSWKMVETLNMLAATLGTTTSIYEDNREGRLGKEPNFAVLIYRLNRERLSNLWFKKKDRLWMRIKSIERLSKSVAYCFEVENNEPMFTIGTTGILTHNCRLRLDKRELYNRGGGGLFGAGALTGSIGVCTINLPRIGYLSKTKKEFFERLKKVMDIAKESLEIKRKTLEYFIEKGLYPYSRHYLEGVKQMRGAYFGNHFSTIGLVGMNEAWLNFLGENIASKKGQKLTLEVLDFMREQLVRYQKETDNLYNLEQTPAEGTSYRLALKDRAKYPGIITAGTKAVGYYTNSTQLPVNYTDDVFEALRLQDKIQSKYTGGSVLHLFLGERLSDAQAVKALVKKIFENFHLPYITITPTFSICPSHGYLSGEHFFCPECTIKQPCEVYSRVVGYIRPVNQWHTGKQQEYKDRKEFKVKASQL
jgi:ribonucleoside-triphosphate reductase